MFDTEKPVTRLYADFDVAKEELVDLEQQVAAARARQTEILAWLDAANVARCERARSLEEWTAGNLDIAPATARSLVTAARARGQTTNTDTGEGAGIDWETLGEESVTFDRAVAIVDLVAAGGTHTTSRPASVTTSSGCGAESPTSRR